MNIDCSAPPYVNHASVTYDSLKHGSTVRYSCNHGYEASTNHTNITCYSGVWSKPSITCDVKNMKCKFMSFLVFIKWSNSSNFMFYVKSPGIESVLAQGSCLRKYICRYYFFSDVLIKNIINVKS